MISLKLKTEIILCLGINYRDLDDHASQLRKLLANSRQIKKRWHETFEETTQNLQRELKALQDENSLLAIENQKLRAFQKNSDAGG